MRKLWHRMRGRRGQTMVEYALILGVVTIILAVWLPAIGSKPANTMGTVGNALP